MSNVITIIFIKNNIKFEFDLMNRKIMIILHDLEIHLSIDSTKVLQITIQVIDKFTNFFSH